MASSVARLAATAAPAELVRRHLRERTGQARRTRSVTGRDPDPLRSRPIFLLMIVPEQTEVAAHHANRHEHFRRDAGDRRDGGASSDGNPDDRRNAEHLAPADSAPGQN